MTNVKKRDQLIKKWLQNAGEEIKQSLKTDLKVETKSSKSDLVTKMDREIEKKLVKKIKENFPKDKIISEEGFGDDLDDIDRAEDRVWYLDPIDGTLNFVLQNEKFAIMVAIYDKNIGQQAYIYDVMKDKLYWSLKGQGVFKNNKELTQINNTALTDGLFASNSRFISDEQVKLNAKITKHSMGVRTIGSAAMEAVELVEGNTVAYLSYGLNAWDIAAGYMMINEIGGSVQRLDGLTIDFLDPAPSIMGTKQAVKDIQDLL
ncbi:MAG: inositol monophosphatase family protein [Atopostipes sp.]|nr:inositol monophosphatase family protein [Staphylococcus equorum]MDN6161875.1 inositol monophosphatase family protein [Atopostipes sp.]